MNLYHFSSALEGLANRLAAESDEEQKDLINKQLVLLSPRSSVF